MKVLSLNTGKPANHLWKGKQVSTAIFKVPAEGPRKVSFHHIDGDGQADLRVHGGVNKAVYAYDAVHYEHWKKVLQRSDWPYGLFGENLTTEGLPDDDVRIGNIYRVGSATLQVVQPRFPCTKLNVRFSLPDMMERFAVQKRAGIYFRVLEEGWVQAGDSIELLTLSTYPVTVQAYVNCYYAKEKDMDLVTTVLSIPFLPESQRKAFESFLSPPAG